MQREWKKAVVFYFEVHLTGETEKNHTNYH